MSKPFLTVILVTTTLILVTPISRPSINGQCLIDYNQVQSNQNNITFESCLHNNSRINSWHQCQSLCCTTNATIQKIIKKLDDCLKRNLNQQSYQFKYVLLSVVLFIILFILLVYLISKGLAYYHKIVTSNKTELDPQQNRVTKSIQNIKWIQDSHPSFQISSQEINQSKMYLRKNHICSLCLKCQVNIYSYCGHSFHSECFYNWATLKRKCPKCIKFKITQIKIYCNQCYSCFFILPIQEYLKIGPVSVECLNCFTKQQAENKIIKHYWVDEQCSGSCQQDTK